MIAADATLGLALRNSRVHTLPLIPSPIYKIQFTISIQIDRSANSLDAAESDVWLCLHCLLHVLSFERKYIVFNVI